jgi:F-type H+-transporting ATPase subunit b
MEEILRELGELVLGSVPTMILFLILVLAYQFILYRPLMRTRAARFDRTRGAMERAYAAIAAADAKSQEYEAKLRAARAAIYRAREERLQRWNAEKEIALASARLLAQERTEGAKKEIAAQAVLAKTQLQASASQLAAQVLEAVLPVAAAGSVR